MPPPAVLSLYVLEPAGFKAGFTIRIWQNHTKAHIVQRFLIFEENHLEWRWLALDKTSFFGNTVPCNNTRNSSINNCITVEIKRRFNIKNDDVVLPYYG